MRRDAKSLYQALIARDRRFDGLFFVGVKSTGIYCRPICPVKPPKEINCRFYSSAPEAEQAGFRPCLRCRPELAPGNAPVDGSQRIAHLIVNRIEEGVTDGNDALETLAAEFALSSRQIRRIVRNELGVSPVQLLLTRRLLLAKQLLTETRLPVIDVAFASGFSSLRRFNDAFRTRYRMPPSRLRKEGTQNTKLTGNAAASTIQIQYRPPYDWAGILAFLRARAIKGVEWAAEDYYARTVRIGDARGWIKVSQTAKKDALTVEFAHSLSPVLPALLNRVRDLFDVNAHPGIISGHFAADPIMGPLVASNPGLRVPGAFNGFELGLRAILGQQVSVAAATTLSGRVAAGFGERIETPFSELNRLSPTAKTIAKATSEGLARLGIVRSRCNSILALVEAQTTSLSLDSGIHHDPEKTIHRLAELPGIGMWTANYIAMRALRWPDAFPKEDLVIRKSLSGVTAREAEEISQAWRPWRSYAVMHLWRKQGKAPDVVGIVPASIT